MICRLVLSCRMWLLFIGGCILILLLSLVEGVCCWLSVWWKVVVLIIMFEKLCVWI